MSHVWKKSTVRCVANIPVMCCLFNWVRCADDAPPNYNDVASADGDHLRRSEVLLPELISGWLKMHSGSHVDEARVRRDLSGRYESDHCADVVLSQADCIFCVRVGDEVSFAAHFSDQQTGNGRRMFQAFDDSRAWQRVSINNVRPFTDLVDPPCELFTDGVADVGKFSVFEDQEIVTNSQFL